MREKLLYEYQTEKLKNEAGLIFWVVVFVIMLNLVFLASLGDEPKKLTEYQELTIAKGW